MVMHIHHSCKLCFNCWHQETYLVELCTVSWQTGYPCAELWGIQDVRTSRCYDNKYTGKIWQNHQSHSFRIATPTSWNSFSNKTSPISNILKSKLKADLFYQVYNATPRTVYSALICFVWPRHCG